MFYLDRVQNKLRQIRYTDILRFEDNFIVMEGKDEETYIPMHRIRKVEKKGEVFWERK